MTSRKRAPDAGLSLMEVLVSLVILSMIGLACVTLLQALVRTDAQLADRTEQIRDLDRALSLVRTSIANAASVTLDTDLNQLTLETAPALGASRISYIFDDGTLQRIATSNNTRLVQDLTSALRTPRWAPTQAPNLFALQFALPSGAEGSRQFYHPKVRYAP